MNSLRSYSDLKMNRITRATPPAAVVLPPRAHPRQDGIVEWIDTQSGEVKSPTEFVQGGAGTIGGNLRDPGFPEPPKFGLLGR